MTETSPVASVCHAQVDARPTSTRTSWPTCAPPSGMIVARRRAAGSSSPATGEAAARGTARPAASCRSRGPWIAARLLQRRPARPSRSPTTAGCAPATSPRSTPDGYIRLVDRTKDVIKSGGEWISLGRARERDHGPPEGRGGGGHRHPPPEVGRAAAGLRRASSRARSIDQGRGHRLPRRPGGQVVAARRRGLHRRGAEDVASASSPRRTCASASPTIGCPPERRPPRAAAAGW